METPKIDPDNVTGAILSLLGRAKMADDGNDVTVATGMRTSIGLSIEMLR